VYNFFQNLFSTNTDEKFSDQKNRYSSSCDSRWPNDCGEICTLGPFSYHLFPLKKILLFPKGLLKGFDQTINLILDESHERVFSSTSGVEQVVLGLYIIRGDNM
jgi:hypothetical protein